MTRTHPASMVRRVALVAGACAALWTAAGAEAFTSRIAVAPSPARAGVKTTVAVTIAARSGERPPAALYLKVTSPRGATLRVKLTRRTPTSWRTFFVFFEKGEWRLRAVAGSGGTAKPGTVLGTRSVLVRQT